MYLRSLTWAVLAAVLLATIAGCGGGGGSNDALLSRYGAMLNAANSESLSATMANYSAYYLQDGYTWYDVRDTWDAIFSDPNYSIRFSNWKKSYSNISGGFGYLEGTVHVKENDGGLISEGDLSFAMYFDSENGRWLLYGNQNTRPTSGTRKDRVFGLLGLQRGQ